VSAAPEIDEETQKLLASSEVVATRHDRGWNFLLSQPAEVAEQPIDLAALRCAVPEAGAAVLFGAQVLAPPSLGLSVAVACAPLLKHALNHLAEVRQWNVVSLAALPGLYATTRLLPSRLTMKPARRGLTQQNVACVTVVTGSRHCQMASLRQNSGARLVVRRWPWL
jgi:hypothetical protein